jgi:hypothetical protein
MRNAKERRPSKNIECRVQTHVTTGLTYVLTE